MKNDNWDPKPGEFYKNDQGKLFQIVTIAYVPETNEKMLVYQELQDDFKVFVKPLSGFSFQACQNINEEQAEALASPITETESIKMQLTEKQTRGEINSFILDFLDARTNEEKLQVLIGNKNSLTERILDDIALSLDLRIEGKSIEEGFYCIKRHLEALIRYEGSRLR